METTTNIKVQLEDTAGKTKECAMTLKKLNVGEYGDFLDYMKQHEAQNELVSAVELIKRSVLESSFPKEELSKLDLDSLFVLMDITEKWYGPLFDRAKRMSSRTSSSGGHSKQA